MWSIHRVSSQTLGRNSPDTKPKTTTIVANVATAATAAMNRRMRRDGRTASRSSWFHTSSLTGVVDTGWFVGAVVAEWRVDRMALAGSRRTAALVPRRLSDYVALWMIWLPIAMFALVLGVEVLGLLNAPAHRGELITWLIVTLLSLAAIGTVSRHVLARPQPVTAADVVAADEVRRAASLRVLAGSAIAIGGYLLAGVAGFPLEPVWLWETWQPLAGTLVAILLPVLAAGVAILSRPYHAHRLGIAR